MKVFLLFLLFVVSSQFLSKKQVSRNCLVNQTELANLSKYFKPSEKPLEIECRINGELVGWGARCISGTHTCKPNSCDASNSIFYFKYSYK